jgi:hypothetical protein
LIIPLEDLPYRLIVDESKTKDYHWNEMGYINFDEFSEVEGLSEVANY